ncbi:2-dehydro-3-deoxy-phosphogluconate aldolase [Vallitalea maricola]|uniref:2-dehydro-3-deoxy-phosphogluconate aldolase n=1 Tax=Vallitalea maricola TaxID=3074433 RepID=A0ACB5UFN0_9FIRM|nr:2-dehydro-3-deoxy-phosphogluconate aldolase [Vallitalea sp. AN17-2]
MSTEIKFYKDRVAINFLAKDAKNGREVYDAMDGYTAIGVLSNQFESAEEGIEFVNEFKKEVPCVSVGLGAGDPAQGIKAATIAANTNPGHVNQVFTSAGYASGALMMNKDKTTKINVLMSPTGVVGKVKINTGERSCKQNDAIIDVETALAMLLDMEADSVKFYPMRGLEGLEELKYVAEASAKMGVKLIEPTGGITVENFSEILKVCLNAGVEKVMPHVYGAAINKETKETDVEIVKDLFNKVKELV